MADFSSRKREEEEKLKLQAAMNGPSPLCVQFGGSGAVLLCEVPPNCTQRGKGPLSAACSFNWMATEAAVQFLTAADHFDTVQSVKH